MVFDKPTINANDEELLSNDWDKKKYIATYFNLSFHQNERWSLIDTPGVNSSMNKQHGRITRSTLEQREYDAIIHVLNAQQLGTDEEIAHLRWLKKHVQDRLIIFALNKLDVFNSKEDNIDSSMDLVRADLEKIGFENPIICPMSAYFAFLLKKKKLGACFTEDEQDEYDLYVKKFKRSAYDLSRFYPQIQIKSNDDEFTVLMKKCGFYGFEKVIFGAGKLIKQYQNQSSVSKPEIITEKNAQVNSNQEDQKAELPSSKSQQQLSELLEKLETLSDDINRGKLNYEERRFR